MPIVGPLLDGPIPVHEILRTGVETKPDEEALVSRRVRWTWAMLEDVSDRLAAGYLELGLRPGDRVASLMPNRTELLIHYLACMKSGLVAMPLNYRYMAPEIDHALGVGGPRALLAHDERRDDLAASKLASHLPLGSISYDDYGGSSSPSFASLTESRPAGVLAPPKPGDPAIVFFTSGSTGKPKGVCHSFETLGWILASAVKSFDMGSDDVMLPGGSASHVGTHHLSLMTLAVAGRILLARTSDGDELLPLRTCARM